MVKNPRVRIAPSPTGDPHVGTAYVGLFNMVFAKKHGGTFILRIEDTDQTRSTPESEAAILHSLRWAGLQWDEGPDVGGDFGPYRQSERTELYQKYAAELVEKGHAYPCFATSEELAEMRRVAREQKLQSSYDGRYRDLEPAEVEERIARGESYVIRLKFPKEGVTTFADELRGDVTIENAQIDDQILLKSDGFPTYHLANVVDDHLMGITHVIRAEEWISSTPKHVRLYEAFGWEGPVFVHLPLLRNLDKSKISKRKNPVSLEFFRRAGYLPETLLNFLGMMGWSMPDESEKFTVEEMVEGFTWDRISLAGPVFNVEKLEWLNGLYLRDMDPVELRKRIREEILPDDLLDQVIPLLQERLRRLDDFVPMGSFFFTTDVQWTVEELFPKGMDKKTVYRGLKDLSAFLDTIVPWTADVIEPALGEWHERNAEAWSKRNMYMLVRLIATGRKASPPLFSSMEVIGKALCQDRFRRATLLFRP